MFRTCQGLYPYDVYNIQDTDIDKPESASNDRATMEKLRENFERYGNLNRA